MRRNKKPFDFLCGSWINPAVCRKIIDHPIYEHIITNASLNLKLIDFSLHKNRMFFIKYHYSYKNIRINSTSKSKDGSVPFVWHSTHAWSKRSDFQLNWELKSDRASRISFSTGCNKSVVPFDYQKYLSWNTRY